MPDLITCEPLTLDKLHLLRSFDGGMAPGAAQVADWITGRSADCAARDLKKRRCDIFLYRNLAEEVIGFGALGRTKGQWPHEGDPRLQVAIIPWLGLDKKYHGKPDGPDEIRYSDQVLADLVYKAKDLKLTYLVLFVHPANTAALKLYARNGFAQSNKPLVEGEHVGMFLNLDSVPG